MKPRKAKHASKLGSIRLRYKDGMLTYEQMGGNQSRVDGNGVSVDTYIHAIYGLVMQSGAKAVLMVGCGGGTLATMLARAGKAVTVVDVDPVSIKLAQKHFGLPKDVKCHVGDGVAFLKKTKQRFDALIVDAFIGETIPPQFTTDDFFRLTRKRVTRTGAVFMNVCLESRADPVADNLARGFKRNDWRVRLFDQPGGERNAIVLAGRVKQLRKPALVSPPLWDAPRIRRALKAMRFRRVPAAKPANSRRKTAT